MMDVEDPLTPFPLSEQSSDTRQLNLCIDPQLLTCDSYDCVPLVAALHPSPIFSLATTTCYRWVLTGSEDGYIRKWDFFASMNGKTSLTQVQRHHYVDSVVYSEQTVKHEFEDISQVVPRGPTEPKLSPVYSLAMHSEALWALQGCENGSINLTTVRHEEGKCHHVLRKHTGPVSILVITPDETGAISGSWDKSVLEWDLHTGSVLRSYEGHHSQIASTEFQPLYPYSDDVYWNKKNGDTLLTTSVDGQCLLWDRREPSQAARKLPIPDKTPPWCLSATWSADGSKIYMGRRNGTVDEYDFGSQTWIQSFRMPANSGPVSCVKSMPNGKHIICASNDNIRIWDTTVESNFIIRPDTEP
ncbi:Transcription factor spt8, partial [Rhizopus stolonifer]